MALSDQATVYFDVSRLPVLVEVAMPDGATAGLVRANAFEGDWRATRDLLPGVPLPGTWFKLLDYDRNRSYTVILLRIEPDAPATAHKHIGAANAFILQGGFGYEHGEVYEGDFMVEAGGVTHTPHVHEKGCTLLGFMYGTVQGFNPDGSIAGVMDVDWHIEQVKENNAFAHLEGVQRS